MDHVIEGILTHLNIEYDELVFESRSKKYSKLSECPSYGACKAMVDAIHVLEKYYYGEIKTMSVAKWVAFCG